MATKKKATTKRRTTKKATKASGKAKGIGQIAREAIRNGQTNEQALAAVRKTHPGASNLACVAWYRSRLRSAGEDVKKSSEL